MATGHYLLPSSKDDVDYRLVLQHEFFRAALSGQLLSVPAPDPGGRVLDIGTGTGLWACELAWQHPKIEVIGTDLFQTSIAPPSNCRFVVRDVNKDWGLGYAPFDVPFDIIHTRLIPFQAQDLPNILRQCYSSLKPGGYIEMQDVWNPIRTDEPPDAPEHKSNVIIWANLRMQAAMKLGIDLTVAGQLPELLSKAGFTDVQARDYKCPIGSWSNDTAANHVGNMFRECLQLSKMDLSKELLKNVGMEEREIIDLVEKVGQELGVGKIYARLRFVHARKPE